MFRFTPPAGIPVSLREIARAFGLRVRGASCAQDLTDDIRKSIGAAHAYHFGSGRAALTVILQSLSSLTGPGKDEVVIPAYTCFSVASSVARAGLKIKLCDVNPTTLDYDYDELAELNLSRTVAVIACSLFGILCDWEKLRRLGTERGVFLVDDAAQAFGISDGETFSGTMGDVGFFSLGRGKSLTTYSGGIAVTNDDLIGREIEKRVSALDRPSQVHEIRMTALTALYALFLNPRLYWIPSSLPFLGLGETVFDPEFAVERLGEFQGRIGQMGLRRLSDILRVRVQNSQKLINQLDAVANIQIPGARLQRCIPYVRLPIVLESRAIRDAAVNALKSKGIGASSMYPSTINEISGIDEYLDRSDREFFGATEVAARLIALPTHPYVTETDVAAIADTLRQLAAQDGR